MNYMHGLSETEVRAIIAGWIAEEQTTVPMLHDRATFAWWLGEQVYQDTGWQIEVCRAQGHNLAHAHWDYFAD